MNARNKIPLYGFNNLTKNLSFSLYRLHYLTTKAAVTNYNDFVDQTYNSDKLTGLLSKVCHAIGGNVLNIAKQDYSPQGASVTLMISEEAKPESLVAHLDKSHLCIHTYPEERPQDGIAIFRADIELSTCGVISPLKVLDYVIETFDADIVDIDYRTRGMTRDELGNKHFTDHNILTISESLTAATIDKYQVQDHVMSVSNLFHCKLARQSIELAHHVFEYAKQQIPLNEEREIKAKLTAEISDIFTSEQQVNVQGEST